MESKERWYTFTVLLFIICAGAFLRTRNLGLLEYRSLVENDGYRFFRYAQDIVDHGSLMAHDSLRLAPRGMDPRDELNLVAYAIACLYKIGKLLIPPLTVMQVAIWYPVVAFAFAMVFFFFLVRELFDKTVAFLACALLAVVPSFLFRTIAGFADKEPLAILVMFGSLYLYVRAWQSKRVGVNAILGVLAGIGTGLMGLAWRGVFFAILIIVLYNIILQSLGRFRKRDYYLYVGWYVPVMLVLSQGTNRYGGLTGMVTSESTALLTVFLLASSLNSIVLRTDLTKVCYKLKDRVPEGIGSLLIVLILSLSIGGVCIVNGYRPLFFRTSQSYDLFQSYGDTSWENRLLSSIAEYHQPFLSLWWSFFGFLLPLFLLGSIALLYRHVRNMRTARWILAAYVFLMGSILLTRFSEGSLLDGRSVLSHIFYLGPFVVFGVILLFALVRSFHKEQLVSKQMSHGERSRILVLVWFVLTAVAARRAERFFFVLTPVAVVLASYAIIEMAKLIVRRHVDGDWLLSEVISTKSGRWGVAVIVVLSIVGGSPSMAGLARSSYDLAKKTGSTFDQQWDTAAKWIRTTTPRDAVFAAEWDCGLWIQSIGQRATILDEGTTDYRCVLFARHVLCAQNEDEALMYLRTHGATHLLMSFREVGTYSLFSHYGSDESDDRRSQIGKFQLDPRSMQMGRTGFHYYGGIGWPLDRDIMYKGKLYPKAQSRITDIFVPIQDLQNRLGVEQPVAVVSHGGTTSELPLRSVFIEGQEYRFDEGLELEGCLRIIPTQDGSGDLKPYGVALYVSEKAMGTLWVQLFLLGRKSDRFENVYDDEHRRAVTISGGRLAGPVKIWRMHYEDADISFTYQ